MPAWQLFVKGWEGKTYTINPETPDPDHPKDMSVTRLKELVKEKIGLPIEEQMLIYGGKQLEDGKLLGHYPALGPRATLYLVGRLPGGVSLRLLRVDRRVPLRKETCPITMDDTCVKMPCGHSISPDAVMQCAKSKIDDKEHKIRCPLSECNKEWPIDVLKRYGGASNKELGLLEDSLSRNYCDASPEIIQCPSCSSYCTRIEPAKKSVQCSACTKRLGGAYRFCFACLQDWKNGHNEYTCGNPNCDDDNEQKRILRECPMTKMQFSETKCPSIRRCPNPKCQSLIEHIKGCKHMTCKACKAEFCFVCLREKVGGSWHPNCGRYSTKCVPAPRQVPV